MTSSLLRNDASHNEANVTTSRSFKKSAPLDSETEVATELANPEKPTVSAAPHQAVRLQTLLRVAQKEAALRRRLAEEIALKVAARIPGALRSFQVAVNDDHHYVLEGNCISYHAKQVAQHEAMLLVGDSQVVNEIVVHRAR
ncbi:MAG: hypothetical protein RH917_06960 [Lacipirellulaceae bacterium]